MTPRFSFVVYIHIMQYIENIRAPIHGPVDFVSVRVALRYVALSSWGVRGLLALGANFGG